ncbi:MAG: bifunctional diguanylate cyclase/phosphohydrolase [Solirubrobacterales bacterium]
MTSISQRPVLGGAAAATGAALAIALAVYAAHMAFGLGSPDHDFLIEEWVYDFITLSAALVTVAMAIARPKDRLPWLLVGAGLMLWAGGDLHWTAVLSDLDEPPFPSASDAGYLAGYVLVLAGVAGLARGRVERMRTTEWFDIAIGALSVAVIGTTLLMDYVVANTSGTTLEVAVALAYPVLDLTTLTAAIAAIMLTGWHPGRGLALVCAGICVVGVGDAVYTYQSLAGTYTASSWNNLMWPLGVTVIAIGSLQPSPRRRISSRPGDWRSFASPAIFGLVVLSFLILDRGETDTPIVSALTLVTMAAIVARVAVTFGENRRLVSLLKQDSLTGLGNRSKLNLDLERLYEETGENQEPHVLTILDLNGFKAYNDAFGHPAGDAVLKRLGGQLAEALAERGTAYRLGGDEFALLAVGDLEGSSDLIARATVSLSERGEGFMITSSAGSSELPREARDPSSALQLTDQRMYEDKDSRRPTPGREVEAVLISIIQQRSPVLGAHGAAVASLATGAAERLGLPESERTALARAAELHDIGKIAIPDAILQKPGPLSPEEWEFMRQHTVLGERILSAAPSLAALGGIVRATHERWDGDGYPDRIAADEIPVAARIIFACDAYATMTGRRPYSSPKTHSEAVEELRRCSGTWFDPRVVEAVIEAAEAGRLETTGTPAPAPA